MLYEAGLIAAWVIVRNQSTPFISIPIDDEMNARFDMVGVIRGLRTLADHRTTALLCSHSAKPRVYQG